LVVRAPPRFASSSSGSQSPDSLPVLSQNQAGDVLKLSQNKLFEDPSRHGGSWAAVIRRDTMAKALAQFTIDVAESGYLLTIEDEDGTSLELTATPEQLDLIAEAIEEHLETDDEEIDAAE
jgi:hypothetical protein